MKNIFIEARQWDPWSKREEKIVRENLGYITAREIGKLINRTAAQVNMKVDHMRRNGEDIASVDEAREIRNAVKQDEVNFIKNNIGMEVTEISQHLSKSKVYVWRMIRDLEADESTSFITERAKALEKTKKDKAEKERRERINKISRENKAKAIKEKRERLRRVEEKIKLERERKEMQEIYDNAIDRKVTAGVYKKEVKVKLGQPYEIERVVKSIKDWNKFAGKCIHETKDHFTIKNKVRAETFLKVDFLINEYRIKEIA